MFVIVVAVNNAGGRPDAERILSMKKWFGKLQEGTLSRF